MMKNLPMRTIRLILLITAITGALFSGCKKNEIVPTVKTPAKTLSELKAADSFNWSTGSLVEVKITGLPTTVPVKSTLTIGLADGTTLFSKLHRMDENTAITLMVPATVRVLTLKYGTVAYSVDIVNRQASFSFIPVITDK